jgi:serum amyloid A protein
MEVEHKMVQFKWHTGGIKPCYKCSRWDGYVFDKLVDVPDLPVHPNCTCKIEAIGLPMNKELSEIGLKIDTIRTQVNRDLSDLNFFTNIENLLEKLIGSVKLLLDEMYQISRTIDIFWKNYQEMKIANTIGSDKYFHSKANAEAAQLGVTAEHTAKFISDFREFYEYFTNVHLKKMSLQATLEDSLEDQRANHYGRAIGRKFPDNDPSDLVNILRPRGLDAKY